MKYAKNLNSIGKSLRGLSVEIEKAIIAKDIKEHEEHLRNIGISERGIKCTMILFKQKKSKRI